MSKDQNKQQLDNAELVNCLLVFCRENGAPVCYQNYSPEALYDYLAFHCAQKTFAWTRCKGLIVGTGVAWQCNEREIRAAAASGKLLFNWKPTNPKGDSVFFADFVCTMPGALKSVLTALVMEHPQWTGLKWFTFRRKNGKEKLVQINRRYAAKVITMKGVQ